MPTTTLSSLFDHLWQSTLFAAAAALLAFALRSNQAQMRYRLWLIASLKFLVPFSALIAVGGCFTLPATVPVARPALSAAAKQIGQPFAFAVPEVLSSSSGSSVANSIPVILFAIWLSGVVAVLFSWAKRWTGVRAIVRAAAPLSLETPIPVLSSSSLVEPGVFGIFRPVLLLPAGITGHLTPSHLEAILAHELCHVHRRDNLAAAIHMAIEAVFWFHPLVWWIGARMVEERENACDEEVLRLGNQPGVYAESILKTCQLYLEAPLTCVSGVTGSDLKKRITRIMAEGLLDNLNFRKKLLLAVAGVTAIALPLAIGLLAQSQPAASFEVASIKPSKPGTLGPMVMMRPGGSFVASGISVKFLLEEAYGVKDSQISQMPPWLDSERYDIDAKPEDSIASTMDKLSPDQRRDQFKHMLQSLLTERFKLALGHETKDLPVYALVVAKSGPKLQKSSFVPPDKLPASPPPPRAGGAPPGGFIQMQGPGQLVSTGIELSILADVLSRVSGRPVLDKTGLTGRYDFKLQWTPEEGPGVMGPGGPPPGAGDAPPPESSGPSLFTAIQEQLGLKLESQKAPLDVLVIEHVERPTEN